MRMIFTRRDMLKLTAAGAASMLLPRSLMGAESRSDKPLNFVIILSDDLGARELGCYGNKETKTPNLDALAKSGVMFRTAWATPLCSPTRAMTMTGRYGFRTEWYAMEEGMKKREPLCDEHLIFARHLKNAGYATAVAGKWQLPGECADYGFDEHCMWEATDKFDGPREKKGEDAPGRAARYWHAAVVKNGVQIDTKDGDYGPDIFCDFVIDFISRHKDEKFCVYYPECLVHGTWDFDRGVSGYVAPPELDSNGKKTGKKSKPTLKANVEYLDHLMGRLVAKLDELGVRDNTVVIFLGDNGTAGAGKATVDQERGSRVPLIANCPGVVKAADPTDELASYTDIFPTVAELANAPLPKDYIIDGVSFAPLLTGKPFNGRDHIFGYLGEARMLRDKRWLQDGTGKLYDCGDKRDEEGYIDVTDSKSPEAAAARKRFEALLEKYPAPVVAEKGAPDMTRAEKRAGKTGRRKNRK